MKKTLDITKEHCPMNFVKVKLELSHLETGDVLDVILCGKEPLENIPRSVKEQGHKVIEIYEKNGFYHVIIEKRT